MNNLYLTAQTARSFGLAAEEVVVQFLQERGYVIVEQNVCRKGSEIDIVAHHTDTIVFVEVKASTSMISDLSERVTPAKQRRLQQAARHYMSVHALEDYTLRFDVALVHNNTVTYIESAFYADI